MCKHPSHLGMQLKYPVYKSCVHLHKLIILSTVAALAVSLSRHQMAKIVMKMRKKEPGAKTERKTESVNAATTL